VKRKVTCLLFYGVRKSLRRVVRNDFANKIVHCGNRKCVVGLGDNVLKVTDGWKVVKRVAHH
jgi:hypothetical protein